MPGAPVVHVVDDDDSVRVAVARLLDAAGYEVRAYSSAGEFLIAAPGDAPGCVVLDVRMPGPSGLELQDALAKQGRRLPVIFLSGHGDVPMSVRAMKAGAVDFLTKPVERDALLDAVSAALARDVQHRTARLQVDGVRARYETMTAREREVFAGVVAGKLNKRIATELGTAERTVKAHRSRVMVKMGVTSVAELVRLSEQLKT